MNFITSLTRNELLRAMDSRLKALRKELAVSLERAAGSFCSVKDISHLVNCCDSLEAMTLKYVFYFLYTFQKYYHGY